MLEKRVPRPFTLVGHSMGGPVALAYAAEYPQRVSRLVLVDAAGVLHRSVYAEFLVRVAAQRAIGLDSPWFESVVRAIQIRAENWPLRGELALERAGVRRRLLRGDPSAISAFAMVEHDFSRDAARDRGADARRVGRGRHSSRRRAPGRRSPPLFRARASW